VPGRNHLPANFPQICLYIAVVMGATSSLCRIDFLNCGDASLYDDSRVHVKFKFHPSGVTDRMNIP
jgi:hypothetical protein